MWEFSIEMDSSKLQLGKYLYNELKIKIPEVSGIITSYEQNSKIIIVLGCEEIEKSRLQYHIAECISKGICTFFKESFLENKLKILDKNKLEQHTFKKALISFDRETDKFLINKYLKIEKNIVLESFFHFKLTSLKEKWEELIKIANDNSTYLLSDDSFIELLKFLIDNIEIATDEVSVVFNNEKAKIFSANMELIGDELSSFDLISKLLELSPRKIYWQTDKKQEFLEKILEKRILYTSNNNFFKEENVNKSLQN